MTGRSASGAAAAAAAAGVGGETQRSASGVTSSRSKPPGSSAAKGLSGRRDSSWGLTPEQQALHKNRLMAFYATHQPAKAHQEHINTAFGLFGPGVWDELERKYRGKTAGFRPMPPT